MYVSEGEGRCGEQHGRPLPSAILRSMGEGA